MTSLILVCVMLNSQGYHEHRTPITELEYQKITLFGGLVDSRAKAQVCQEISGIGDNYNSAWILETKSEN